MSPFQLGHGASRAHSSATSTSTVPPTTAWRCRPRSTRNIKRRSWASIAGRRINDGMANYVAQDIIKTMLQKKIPRRLRAGGDDGRHFQTELS